MTKFVRLVRYDWPLQFILLITNVLPDNVLFIRLRGFLARPFFKKCGKQLGIGRHVTIYNPSQVEIGQWVYIAYGCWFSASMGVIIEDEVMFGPYNVIATSNHTKMNNSYRFGPTVGNTIVFKKGCWIGAHCTVLPGSIVGEGSVIGANTVVSGSIDASCLFAGSPGSIRRKFPKEDRLL